jgi:hypothetical protein
LLVALKENIIEQLEINVIVDKDDDRLLKIEYGDIVEVEQPDSGWYSVLPDPAIVDTFARFFQQLIRKRDGVTPVDLPRDPESGLTREGLIGKEAENLAESLLHKVCRKIDVSEDFYLLAEVWMEDWVKDFFEKAPSEVA